MRFSAVLLCAFLCVSSAMAAEKPLTILRVTPDGDNISVPNQIVIEFNRPVVPTGRMARTGAEVGVKITPALKCDWRWTNPSTLACNLSDKDIPKQSTSYSVEISQTIKAMDGATIAKPETHQFTTMRPHSVYTNFKAWGGPETPVIRVAFNQPVTKTSVEQHLFFASVKGEARHSVVVRPDPDEEQNAAEPKQVSGDIARDAWLVEPKEPLKSDADFILKSEAGLVSSQGPETNKEGEDLRPLTTYPKPTFVGIQCYNNKGDRVLLKSGGQTTEECDPLNSIALAFTAPVRHAQVRDFVRFAPDLTGGLKDGNLWTDWEGETDEVTDGFTRDNPTTIQIPTLLKAAQTYTITPRDVAGNVSVFVRVWHKIAAFLGFNASLTDKFGRAVVMPDTFSFSTDHRRANFEMPYRDAVLEKAIDSDVPLYVNNITGGRFSYTGITAAGGLKGRTHDLHFANVQDVQYAVPMGIRALLNGASGAVYGKITVDGVQKPDSDGVLFAQVTPFQVQFKQGHFRSLAWVVDMATGKPVAGARVSVYTARFNDLGPKKAPLGSAETNADGIAYLPGNDVLDPDRTYANRWRAEDERLFVRVDKGANMALLPLTSAYSVETCCLNDAYIPANEAALHGHLKAWGMSAQGVYHVGDTIQYKIYLRDQNNEKLILPPQGKYTLTIKDSAGNDVDTIDDITFSEFGAYAGEYTIPKSAPVGFYTFILTADFSNGVPPKEGEESKIVTLDPLRVLVSDFMPSPFRVSTELNGDHFTAGDNLDMSTLAQMHAGGAYTDADVRMTVTLDATPFESKQPGLEAFYFSSFENEKDSDELLQKESKLDDKGGHKESFTLPAANVVHGRLTVESAVRDDRGKSVGGRATADYTGVDRLVGIKSPHWTYEAGKPATLQIVVVDPSGKAVAGTNVAAHFEREEIVTAKVKGAGNAYLSDVTRSWKPVGECTVHSAAAPQDCTFTPAAGGLYRLVATIKDTKGVPHETKQSLWVVGGAEYVQWGEGSENIALPIIPEKKTYKVGDTARYLIKNPYPNAKALVTVERYGVLDSFVTTLEGSTPVVSIPVKPDYVPGFYVSITAFSPRVDAPPVAVGQIDMGKPAMRTGYVSVPVQDDYKAIRVTAKSDQDVYRPRDKVSVDITAVPLHADAKAEPMELAVAVVDESVFDLIAAGRDAYDPYKGFYELDPVDVHNYSLLSALMGRQKFEKKGANPGGDGGADASMRDLFKYVSYWNSSVRPDADGHAHISFDAPDNLTGWRVLAMAVTPTDKMGLGETTFKVNRLTEVRPMMPNNVREGDAFTGGFTVMNRTDKDRTLRVEIKAAGDVADGVATSVSKTVQVGPYKREAITMPLTAAAVRDGAITFTIKAGDAQDADAMTYTLPVLKTRVLESVADAGTTTDAQARIAFNVPRDVYTDTGGLRVTLSPTVLHNVEGAFTYMRDYPYECWEQRLTKGVMAAMYARLKPRIPATFTWAKSDDVIKSMLSDAGTFQTPSGGMAYFTATDDHADPYLSAYTAIAFTWLKDFGYTVPADVSEKLDDYLLQFLRSDTAPDFYQVGMKSTVRAVALDALVRDGKAGQADVLRYAAKTDTMDVFGVAHLLDAALRIDGTQDVRQKLVKQLLAASSESAGKITFNQVRDDGYERILATPVRDACAALDVLNRYGATNEGRAGLGDKPFKILNAITDSQKDKGHMWNTQENMFCANAFASYAATQESVAPDMQASVLFGDNPMGEAKFAAFSDAAQDVAWPMDAALAGKSADLTINRSGTGRLYYTARLNYAPKTAPENVNAGMNVTREFSVKKGGKWTIVKGPLALKRGEIVRVDLFVNLPTARNFVVVNDPLAGGLETVNRDLNTASTVDDAAAQYDQTGGSMWFRFNDWNEFGVSFWNFYHRELRHDSARFFADYLPAGNYHLSYVAQAVASGEFAIPPTRVEEMYAPDIYGLGTAGHLNVAQ